METGDVFFWAVDGTLGLVLFISISWVVYLEIIRCLRERWRKYYRLRPPTRMEKLERRVEDLESQLYDERIRMAVVEEKFKHQKGVFEAWELVVKGFVKQLAAAEGKIAHLFEDAPAACASAQQKAFYIGVTPSTQSR
jgi:hypothetical protein